MLVPLPGGMFSTLFTTDERLMMTANDFMKMEGHGIVSGGRPTVVVLQNERR